MTELVHDERHRISVIEGLKPEFPGCGLVLAIVSPTGTVDVAWGNLDPRVALGVLDAARDAIRAHVKRIRPEETP